MAVRTQYPAVPKAQGEQRLRASLFDRLSDANPDLETDRGMMQAETMSGIRDGLRRDLEMLLNTRCCPISPPEELKELANSAFGYGVEDFFSAGLITPMQREAFALRLKRAIARFEPRLEEVDVSLVADPVPERRRLRLRISARYQAMPGMPPVVFETSMDPVAGRFTLSDTKRSESRRG